MRCFPRLPLLALALVASCGLETRPNPNYHAPQKSSHGTGGNNASRTNAATAGQAGGHASDSGIAGDGAAGEAGSGGAPSSGTSGGGETSSSTAGTDGTAGARADACDSRCSPPLPACDASQQRCVECVSAGDCSDAARPVCESTTHACVQCARKEDCGGNTPLCDLDTHACVQCLGSGDCGGSTNVCDLDSHNCVECLRQSDCTDPRKALCTDKTCGPCGADAQCTRLDATPVCDRAQGACVECTLASEADRCGSKACKLSTGTCTSVDRGTRTACSSCEADSECVNGARCVLQPFDTQSLGPFCFYDQATNTSCANASHTFLRPYSRDLALTSIDGAQATYCLPPPSTTCQGIADAIAQGTGGGKACLITEDCGEPGFSDGVCGDTGATAGKCTYSCDHDYDCPQVGFTVCNKLGTARCE